MIDKKYENELLHEIDHIQRQVKELEEENARLRSAMPIAAVIQVDPSRLEGIKSYVSKDLRVELEKNSKELEVYKKAFEMVCNALDNSGCVVEGDCKEDEKCSECVRRYFLEKAGEADV